ncbi:MAG: pseudouridine synthase [Enterobacterales bacterium]|nr:pseudouridine synthase [Enterobacterales bacterium]
MPSKPKKIAPLKPKNGVFPNCHWMPEGAWELYLDYLYERFPHISKQQWIKRMMCQQVVTADGLCIAPDSKYLGNQHIYFYRELDFELAIPYRETVIFENDHIMLVDKPHFLPVAPTGSYLKETLLVRLRNKYQNNDLELCHRLDRETAGLVLLSKKSSNRSSYHQLFSDHKIKKTYWAVAAASQYKFPIKRCSRIVKGEPYFKMREVEGVINSETLIEQLEQNSGLSLYQLTPKTGKKHQLRLHMSNMKIPIKNDRFYPELKLKEVEDFKQPLQLLAKRLEFIDPINGKNYRFESQLNLNWPFLD